MAYTILTRNYKPCKGADPTPRACRMGSATPQLKETGNENVNRRRRVGDGKPRGSSRRQWLPPQAVSRRLALALLAIAAVASVGAVATAIYKGQPAIAVVATLCAIAWTCFCWWEHVSSKELTRVNTSGTVVDNSGGKSR